MIIIPEIMSFFKFLLNPLRKMLPSVAFAMNAVRLSDKNDASPSGSQGGDEPQGRMRTVCPHILGHFKSTFKNKSSYDGRT